MKTCDLFKQKTVLSFEVFPPKPTSDESVIYKTLDSLVNLKPDFISVTFGAGGGKNCEKSVKIAADIKHKYHKESVAHLPCISIGESDADEICAKLKQNGIENILALRGDITPDTVQNGRFKHASDLIEYLNTKYDFNIIAACYPEGHTESLNLKDDILNLKRKVDCGVSHLITQLFLDNEYFYFFLDRAKKAGIDVPIEAGIMPVTNKAQIERMVKMCGAQLPKKFVKTIEKYENNPTALRDAGIAYAMNQIADLLSQDVDGIHLYTMNNPYVAEKIFTQVGSLI